MLDHTTLIVWQRARGVVLATLEFGRTSWKPYASAVFNQLLRASLSVQLNIAEGYAVRLPRRRRFHWNVAYGSSVETVDCLELLRGGGVIGPSLIDPTIGLARETSRMLLKMLRQMEPH